ncbi:MAG: YlxR family protein [Clostridia bacterium]
MKNPPIRMCIVCRHQAEKNEFFRIVKSQSGDIAIDETGKMNGRGAYICKDTKCLDKCAKQNGLSRVFGQNVPKEVYDELRREFEKKQS